MAEEFLWVEKYRPTRVADTVLPERLKAVFQKYVDDKAVPNLMLTGSAGVGKTTIAKAMCEEIGLSYLLINSSEDRGIDVLRTKIKNYASTVSFRGGRKVIILDEADYLTPEAQAGLRGAIEEYSQNCTFIFTCNFKSRLIDALHSRCSVIDFKLESSEKSKMAGQMFKRVCSILEQENVKFEKEVIAKIVQGHFPDYRRTLNELQRYASMGEINAGVLGHNGEPTRVSELIGFLREKNFGSMRKWVAQNSDVDSAKIFRSIYDGMYDYFTPQTIPQAVVIIAKYQYQSAFVADQEINLVACLTEIMVDCEVKND